MSTVEERLAALERRVEMESGLRASADRDLSDIATSVRAQRHLVQALSITQSEQTEVLERHTEALSRVEAGIAHILTSLNRLIERDGPRDADDVK